MKYLITLTATLAALLFVASSALAQASGSAANEQYEGSEDDIITGVVSEVNDSSVIVSEGGTLYDMTITPDTQFVDGVVYTPEDTPPRGPTAADLKPGLEVEVGHTNIFAQSYPSQGEATSITFLSPWYEGGDDGGTVQETFSGSLTSVTQGEIRVQQNPEASIEDPAYCDQTLDFTLSDETEISGALEVGSQVEVVYTYDPDGFYTQQCPGKFPADSVTVISGDGGGNDSGGDGSGGNESGGSGGNGSGGSGEIGSGSSGEAVASDVYDVLPDTGGPSVVGVALTLAAVTLLAGIYRATSRN